MLLKHMAVLFGAIFAPCIATAACAQYEFAELKAMKKSDLEFAYCMNILESKKAKIHGDAAAKLEAINNDQYRPSVGDSLRNSSDLSAANDEASRCENTADKIARQLQIRHINVSKVRADCHLD